MGLIWFSMAGKKSGNRFVTGGVSATLAGVTSAASGAFTGTPVLGTASATLAGIAASAIGNQEVNATSGALEKTPYSYLGRDSASGIDYTQPFSVEVAVYLPIFGHRGYYNEIIRHGAKNCAFASVAGWSLSFDTGGYSQGVGSNYLVFRVSDGSSYVQCFPSAIGLVHIVCTYNPSTKTVSPYVNGAAGSSVTNPFMALSSITGQLNIGGYNLGSCGTNPAESAFTTSKVGTGEMRIYHARIWQKVLSEAEVSAIYSNWNGTGRVDIPGEVTDIPVSEWLFHEQVGDSSGGAGTGWIKDNRGGNHLKIVSTNTQTGATGATSTTYVPSGNVRIVSPADGATGVSGAVQVRADGAWGAGHAMQYYIECDTANTFDTADLKNSGWTLTDGTWQPALKPSTVYYFRCKARNGTNTSSESAWSSTVSFTTRAVTSYYCRPLASPGTYGTEDGSSRANAWNGLRSNGQHGGKQAAAIQAEGDVRKLAPGDTLWVQDTWGPWDQASTGAASPITPNYFMVAGYGLATHPILVRLDDATYPFKFFAFRHPTANWNWISEGGGVYSTATYDSSVNFIAFDMDADSLPDMGTPIEDKTYYKQTSLPLSSAGFAVTAGRMYVRMPDDASPANRVYYMGGYNSISLAGEHVKVVGGELYGNGMPIGYSNGVIISGATFKYSERSMLSPVYGTENGTIEDCDISRAKNGVYALNNRQPDCGNGWTIRRNWIHHIGIGGYADPDSHCVGIQSGSNWTVEDNLLEYSGSCVEQYTENKDSINLTVQRNVIRKVSERSVNRLASGVTLSNGSHTGSRTGFQILHNVVLDTEGNSFHDSNADAKTCQYNLFLRPGNKTSPTYQQIYSGNSPATRSQSINFQYNVCVEPYARFISGGGNGAGSVTIDNNLYWDSVDTASTANKFYFPGIGSTTYSFSGWQGTGSADGASYYENPLSSAHVPAGFDSLMIDTFCRAVLGDVDGDGDVDAADLTAFDNASPGDGARIAARKLIDNINTYGSY